MRTAPAFRRFVRRIARGDRGTVAIEFGLISSVLIIMLVMAVDLGMAMRHRSQMEGAVRAGLQLGLNSSSTTDEIEDAVLDATDLPTGGSPTAAAERQCFCAGSSDPIDCDTGTCGAIEKQEFVEITLTQDHSWLLGFPGLENPLTLSVQRSIRVE